MLGNFIVDSVVAMLSGQHCMGCDCIGCGFRSGVFFDNHLKRTHRGGGSCPSKRCRGIFICMYAHVLYCCPAI